MSERYDLVVLGGGSAGADGRGFRGPVGGSSGPGGEEPPRRRLHLDRVHPFVPPIAGLGEVEYLTYESLWDLEVLPRHLLVVGGGPVGCEMAQAFRRIGSRVTLVASEDRLLPRDDVAASRVLAEVFAAEGIDLRLGARAERVWHAPDGLHLVAGGEEILGDRLLIAAGRRPNVDGLELEQAGVVYTTRGIQVNDSLRTSQGHIYAAGDCTGAHKGAGGSAGRFHRVRPTGHSG